jgi:predicted Zn-ribbon and HTH transcriptional regulator
MEVAFAAPALPTVAGFTFTVGGKIAKIDKLLYQPNAQHLTELLALILKNGSPCKTEHLRCDDQGEYGGYVNTQCQLGGSDDYVERSDASKQSTSFSQVNIAFKARQNPLSNQALRDAHDYSYRTRKVVTIDLAGGTAAVGITKKQLGVIKCSNCSFTKNSDDVPARCPQCKKSGTVTKT